MKLYRDHAALRKVAPHRVSATGEHIKPQWHIRRNRAGGYIYASDTRIRAGDVNELIDQIIQTSGDNKRIIIKSGAHGNPLGHNYTPNGRRGIADATFLSEDRRIAAWHRQFTTRGIEVVKISRKSKATLAAYAQKNAHVIEGFCYSAADPVVMEAMNLDKVKVFLI